ncbi:MAG: tyrosine-type recombinase/integrase, partial [Deltaproteobacteria bacterium]|nr:tyrosine-type recombinase/integrase [Deltaproteobacteria bacterium]
CRPRTMIPCGPSRIILAAFTVSTSGGSSSGCCFTAACVKKSGSFSSMAWRSEFMFSMKEITRRLRHDLQDRYGEHVPLKSHRAAMFAEGYASQEMPVFCDTNGGFLRRSNVIRRSFEPLAKMAGIRRIRFHDLRHTAATLLLSAKIPIVVVSQMLGHANANVTLGTYAHVLPSMDAEAAATMDRLLG